MTLSICETTTFRWSFEEDVRAYLAAGVPAMGVWRQKLADYGERRGLDLLRQTGIQVSSLQWAGGFTGSDGRTFRESIKDALAAVRLAYDLRAKVLLVHSGAKAGHTSNHAKRLFKEALAQMVPLADELNVTLAIEPMHVNCSSDWTFLTSIKDAQDLVASLESNSVKLVYDTYHLGHDAANVAQIVDAVRHIGLVQLGDSRFAPTHEQNRCRLGDGCLPLQQIVKTLLKAGYSGFFEVELMGEDIEGADYTELLSHSRQVFGQFKSGNV